MELHWRKKKEIVSKIEKMIDFIKQEMKEERALTCILSNIGIMFVSEHEFANGYLKEKYKIEDNNNYL